MKLPALALIAATIVLGGCSAAGSGPGTAGNSPSATASGPTRPVVTVAAQTGPSNRPSGSLPARTPIAPTSGAQGVIDSSAQARSNFDAWWGYEVQSGTDPRRAEADVYAGGRAVCEQMATGQSLEVVQHGLTTERGYGEPGAQALFKAAVSALCTDQNVGYRTDFDRDVDFAYEQILTKVTYTPEPYPIYDYGFFAKDVCNFMVQTPEPGPQVYNHMRAATWLRLMENGNVQTDVLNIYIGESVQSHCAELYLQLPPIMQTA